MFCRTGQTRQMQIVGRYQEDQLFQTFQDNVGNPMVLVDQTGQEAQVDLEVHKVNLVDPEDLVDVEGLVGQGT